jgi:hypothetical protein
MWEWQAKAWPCLFVTSQIQRVGSWLRASTGNPHSSASSAIPRWHCKTPEVRSTPTSPLSCLFIYSMFRIWRCVRTIWNASPPHQTAIKLVVQHILSGWEPPQAPEKRTAAKAERKPKRHTTSGRKRKTAGRLLSRLKCFLLNQLNHLHWAMCSSSDSRCRMLFLPEGHQLQNKQDKRLSEFLDRPH